MYNRVQELSDQQKRKNTVMLFALNAELKLFLHFRSTGFGLLLTKQLDIA